MSEIDTSATGFRRGNKVRSSLPIVRTPSKSHDRSLGLVFLQFRTETKRALLPNEITSIDTVRALFVRSFPRQLTMEYLDHPSVRVYIHDPSKDMFYELEDLKDVKDKSIIRVYEQGVQGPQPGGGIMPMSFSTNFTPTGAGPPASVGPPVMGNGEGENYGYFSEPEFDSEYQSQHVHRKRFPSPIVTNQGMIVAPNPVGQSQYYGTLMFPPQYRSATLGPRAGFIPNQGIQGPPLPPTRGKAYPGYSQTLPRGSHLMSPTGMQVSPGQPAFAIPGAQPPPKPQRSFNGLPGPAHQGLIMIQAQPGMQIPHRPVPIPGNQQLAYHQNRPLPDRPYSVAGNYPDAQGVPGAYPPNPNNGDFSGYLSSPEHRPSPATMMAMQSGSRASFSAGPFGPEGQVLYPAAIYGGQQQQQPLPPRGQSNANGPIDEESQIRMQEMERQIASLTNVVSKALGKRF